MDAFTIWYTKPEYRRRGLVRWLRETLLAWCRAKGFTRVDAHASDAGCSIYAALGFVPTDEMRLIFK